MTGDISERKSTLRQEMREARRALGTAARDAWHLAMSEALCALAVERFASFVGVYSATGSEADPGVFVERWRARGGRFAWPRVHDGEMRFHLLEGPALLTPGFRGIHEPSGTTPESALDTIDLLIVPGLAFDAAGGRLGQGGGYYDRLLSSNNRPLAVGLAYTCQMVDQVPMGPDDQRVDLVITERGIETS